MYVYTWVYILYTVIMYYYVLIIIFSLITFIKREEVFFPLLFSEGKSGEVNTRSHGIYIFLGKVYEVFHALNG